MSEGKKKYQVGQVRPSQLLWTFGPGALIDLPNISVVTMGLEFWRKDLCTPIYESRLLDAVMKAVHSNVKELLMPPLAQADNPNPYTSEGLIGVPVRPFPTWLRCVNCGRLGKYDGNIFKIQHNAYHPERTHFYHDNCPKSKKGKAEAVPSRFLVACPHGHLDDFPWRWFVHNGPSDCKGSLSFYEDKASLQTENLWVKCECGAARSMAFAFGEDGKRSLPACRGHHPHLDNGHQECKEKLRTILLGATNGWFPVTLSVLAIPTGRNELQQIISDHWDLLKTAPSLDVFKIMLQAWSAAHSIPGIDKWTPEVIWQAMERYKQGGLADGKVTEGDLKTPEWDVLCSPNPPTDWPHFHSIKTPVPAKYSNVIQGVLLLDRLRKVNALIGYTRIEASDEFAEEGDEVFVAPLSKHELEWVPACEVHGEGIFIRFDEAKISQWEHRAEVGRRGTQLKEGYSGWRTAHHQKADVGFPGVRYYLLHTLAHLIIREFALECGYNAASIQERIYASNGEHPMAGILLYTAASDSDGTLGGLVELGKAVSLERILDLALHRAEICSSDPLCSMHNPAEDRTLHGAACHACSFLAETSCEAGNRYLDRVLVVPTFDCKDAAFFRSGE